MSEQKHVHVRRRRGHAGHGLTDSLRSQVLKPWRLVKALRSALRERII